MIARGWNARWQDGFQVGQGSATPQPGSGRTTVPGPVPHTLSPFHSERGERDGGGAASAGSYSVFTQMTQNRRHFVR